MPVVKWFIGDDCLIDKAHNIQLLSNLITGEITLITDNINYISTAPIAVQGSNKYGSVLGKININVPSNNEPQILDINTNAPKILTPLYAQVVKTNSTLEFNVRFQGTPLPSICWLRNGKPLENDEFVKIVTSTLKTTRITVKQMERKRGGKFEVIATNKYGEARSSASVVVSDLKETPDIKAPRFVEPLQPKLVNIGDVVILEALVDSIPNSSFQWMFHSLPINVTKDIRIVTHDNKSILIIRYFKNQNVGIYACRAENVGGSVTTTASIRLKDKEELIQEFVKPRFVVKIKGLNLMDGQKMILNCKVIGKPVPAIEWYHNRQLLEPDHDTTIEQDNNGNCSITVHEVFPEDAGDYTCVAVNSCGKAITTGFVSVEGI